MYGSMIQNVADEYISSWEKDQIYFLKLWIFKVYH